MSIVKVTDSNFKTEVLESEKPVLVDFWAEWCGPCRMVAPVVEAVAQEYGDRLKVAKLNVDENPLTASQYGIMSIPSLFIFKDGEIANRMVGYMPKEKLKQSIDQTI
ncbi:thioredoxin [Zhaonella formicivorans]|uniref:thioredoxin n=1 Tax=Zhaonella formicivorans TaxID=2528593 RepID=UPI0010DC8373|nr:thioredoxin [Zhaonella formicivorans]